MMALVSRQAHSPLRAACLQLPHVDGDGPGGAVLDGLLDEGFAALGFFDLEDRPHVKPPLHEHLRAGVHTDLAADTSFFLDDNPHGGCDFIVFTNSSIPR